MAILPTRSTTDANSSADINTLSTRAVDKNDINAKGDLLVGTADNTISRLGIGTNDQVLTADSAQATGMKWAASTGGHVIEDEGTPLTQRANLNFTGAGVTAADAGGKTVVTIPGGGGGTNDPEYSAGSFDYPASNPAPLDTDSGTNGTIKRHLFDDTTEEFVIGQFKVPSDIDTSGTVTFETYGYAVTADGNEIQLRFGHSAVGDSDSWDTAFTNEDSGDKVTDAVQDDLDYFTWTETVANLGWSANDLCRFRLSRIAIVDGTPLSGDYGLVYFKISIPRT